MVEYVPLRGTLVFVNVSVEVDGDAPPEAAVPLSPCVPDDVPEITVSTV